MSIDKCTETNNERALMSRKIVEQMLNGLHRLC